MFLFPKVAERLAILTPCAHLNPSLSSTHLKSLWISTGLTVWGLGNLLCDVLKFLNKSHCDVSGKKRCIKMAQSISYVRKSQMAPENSL